MPESSGLSPSPPVNTGGPTALSTQTSNTSRVARTTSYKVMTTTPVEILLFLFGEYGMLDTCSIDPTAFAN